MEQEKDEKAQEGPPIKTAIELLNERNAKLKAEGKNPYLVRKLNHRHRMLATLVANGTNLKEAAVAVGLKPRRAAYISASPLFKETVEQIQNRLGEKMAEDIFAKVMRDADKNVDFLVGVRDGSVTDDPKMLRERLKASGLLFERQLPKRMEQHTESTVTVKIDGRMLADFGRIIKEDDVGGGPPIIDAEVVPLIEDKGEDDDSSGGD